METGDAAASSASGVFLRTRIISLAPQLYQRLLFPRGRRRARPTHRRRRPNEAACQDGSAMLNGTDVAYGVVSPAILLSNDGLSFVQAMIAGELPAPIARTLKFRLIEVEHGRAVFEGEPGIEHYDPLGVVHGGYASTQLDSALGCAVHTTMSKARPMRRAK
jgi:hypothetical protein